MFAARGIAVSLSVFFLVYSGLSFAILCGWELWRRAGRNSVAACSADGLFALRAFPLVISLALTFAFTVPSFLILEPRSVDEEVGAAPLTFGFCCLLLIMLGTFRAARAQAKASRALAQWLRGAKAVPIAAPVPVFQTEEAAPLLSVAGVCKAKVLVSNTALGVLNDRELQTALRHEIAHVRRHDNLKKLILRFSPFPGMANLERAWADAVEISADDAAVSNASDALDLASALIKLSRLAPRQAQPLITSGLLDSSVISVQARVERLFSWEEIHKNNVGNSRARFSIPLIIAVLAGLITTYSAVLVQLHQLTEWLVR